MPAANPNRRSVLAAVLIAAAAITALAGISVDADESLFGHGGRARAAGPVTGFDPGGDEAVPLLRHDAAHLGSVFDVAAPVGGVTATQDDTTVTLRAESGRELTLNLNHEQTYVFSGGSRWFVGSDKPVAVFSGRDRRVQPIR